jgi:hypothetical protein
MGAAEKYITLSRTFDGVASAPPRESDKLFGHALCIKDRYAV